MPAINIDFLNKLQKNYKDYSNFIETGTYMGSTIFEMEKYFPKLYTVEIKKKFYNNLVNTYKGNKINFYLGSSDEVFEKLLPEINGKSIFFLDGHWSAGNTGKGKKDVPLYEELEHIINLHNDECILIIDDVRMFQKGPNKKKEMNDICNWEDINIDNVLEKVKNRMENHYYLASKLDKNDRLIIHLSKS